MIKGKISNLISLKQEGEYWDFKKEWYKNKTDLLHDIICMANNLSGNDGYIIIGIDEETDYSICDVKEDTHRKRTQDIVSFLREKRFAGGIRPTVYVQTLLIRMKTIDVIVIQNDRNTPYYLTESYKGVFANNIYARIMDTNTPKNSSADIDVVEKLWKKRFGLDAPIFERVILYLQSPKDWIETENGKRFYKYAPEFTIEEASTSDNGYEFYLFNQYDSRPRWYDINIYYHQTLLSSLRGVALDGGRCFTSAPLTDGIRLTPQSFHWDISYKYFIKGSIEHIIHQFYITDDMDEELTARRRFLECILVFNTKFEKEKFDRWTMQNYKKYNKEDFKKELPHFSEIKGYDMQVIKEEYLQALLLQQMLSEFRLSK